MFSVCVCMCRGGGLLGSITGGIAAEFDSQINVGLNVAKLFYRNEECIFTAIACINKCANHL